MSDRVDQCPFLDRSDPRCSRHFSLEHLQNAFRFCFGAFQSCPQYAQLLAERRIRRQMRRLAVQLRAPGEEDLHERGQSPVVQITVAGRVQKRLAGAA